MFNKLDAVFKVFIRLKYFKIHYPQIQINSLFPLESSVHHHDHGVRPHSC